jgi:hypothetical protein
MAFTLPTRADGEPPWQFWVTLLVVAVVILVPMFWFGGI